MCRVEASVFRPGGVTYLRIPAPDPEAAGRFYGQVFGWEIRDRGSFSDAGGYVIGHFISDLPVAGGSGIRPYVYVDDVDATLEAIAAGGGALATPPYPEGDLRVATFTDPAGNEVGIWQRA